VERHDTDRSGNCVSVRDAVDLGYVTGELS